LYNVDKAIEKTEEIIEQTSRVKQGVMQDLFTEGYYEHALEKTNHLWKKLPREWSLVPLKEVAETNPRYPKPDEKVSYIEMDAVQEEMPEPQYIGRRNPQQHSGRRFKAEDTLFARITPCTENGKICYVKHIDTELGIGSTEFAVLSPTGEEILPKFLYHYTRTHTVRDYAISRMRGSTGRQRVPFSVFRKELNIPLPPKDEQEKIVAILDKFDERRKQLKEQKQNLKTLKQGLMQDLLTGKRRTSNKDIEVLEEVKA
jgi:type I restriction enzyme S subunit